MKNKIKKAIFCIIATMLIVTVALSFTSCDESDIYKLIADMTSEDGEESYTFESNITMEFDIEKLKNTGIAYHFQESLDVIPKEIEFIVSGSILKKPNLLMEADISIKDYPEVSAKIYVKGDELFFELNDFSRIIIDVFWTLGVMNDIELALFTEKITHDGNTVLCFDITDFDLSDLDEYLSYTETVVEVKSSVKYGGGKDFTVPDYDKSKVLYFKDIQEQIKKEMLSIYGYRYIELACVMSTEENINYIDIIALKETGEIVPLERVQIDCDLSAVRENPELFDNAEIIPLRYIFELLGKGVKWDADTETVYVFDQDTEIRCGGKLIKTTFYTSITNVVFFDYSYELRDIGEYIEFIIYANDD